MTLLTRRRLKDLTRHREKGCVSIFPPTHRAGRRTRRDPVRFKNLCGNGADVRSPRGDCVGGVSGKGGGAVPARGRACLGRPGRESGHVEILDNHEADAEDLPDAAAAETLLNGAVVCSLAAGEGPGDAVLTAVLRY